MIVWLLVPVVLAGLMAWGFITSRKQRTIDRRHFASFVGFGAGFIAVITATLAAATPNTRPGPAMEGLIILLSLTATTSILVAVLAGLFSRGRQRIAIVSCGIVAAFMYLLAIAGHFGD